MTEVADWHYVPSSDNPADLLSRGFNPRSIKTSTLWWQGPSWLQKNENYWPRDNSINCDLPELKPNEQSFISTKCNLEFPFDNFSKLTKLKRCCAFILRFKNNCTWWTLGKRYEHLEVLSICLLSFFTSTGIGGTFGKVNFSTINDDEVIAGSYNGSCTFISLFYVLRYAVPMAAMNISHYGGAVIGMILSSTFQLNLDAPGKLKSS